ncbi:MAG: amidohydrolase, partial [Bacteroidetes bacterium]|nr:amidohydrolase [Bacteroidota bacterium]
MIIDCHGHFTTTPPRVMEFRKRQVHALQTTGKPLDEP